MYAPECVYWVPSTPTGGDPRREIAVMFDDRRRLEDRIFRMRTGFAWSQAPASRTVRLITNVEVFSARSADARMLRSNFLISEFWGRDPPAGRMGRPPRRAQRKRLEYPGEAGEPDRMRPGDPQSEHHSVASSLRQGGPRTIISRGRHRVFVMALGYSPALAFSGVSHSALARCSTGFHRG